MQKLILPIVFLLLAYGFWNSDEFKMVAAGVAIFLFGMLSLEYDKLRRLIVKVLREIDVVRKSDDPTRTILSLDRLKLEVQAKTEKINSGLDNLIRNNDIDVQTATSLMNDINYCREICWNLLEAGSLLFSSVDRDELAAMQSVTLSEEEVIEMMESEEGGLTQ